MSMITDLTGYLNTTDINSVSPVKHSTNKKAGMDMDMTDYLKLMVASFQNQSIDDVASTSDMMNQMVQMTVVQALTNLNTLVTETNTLNYAASMVGKNVTIGQRDGDDYVTFQGTVTGTGMLNGEQVIFLDDRVYKISDVVAIGSMPGEAAESAEKSQAAAEQQQTLNTRDTTLYSQAVQDLSDALGVDQEVAQYLLDLLDRYDVGEELTQIEMDQLRYYGLDSLLSSGEETDDSLLSVVDSEDADAAAAAEAEAETETETETPETGAQQAAEGVRELGGEVQEAPPADAEPTVEAMEDAASASLTGE